MRLILSPLHAVLFILSLTSSTAQPEAGDFHSKIVAPLHIQDQAITPYLLSARHVPPLLEDRTAGFGELLRRMDAQLNSIDQFISAGHWDMAETAIDELTHLYDDSLVAQRLLDKTFRVLGAYGRLKAALADMHDERLARIVLKSKTFRQRAAAFWREFGPKEIASFTGPLTADLDTLRDRTAHPRLLADADDPNKFSEITRRTLVAMFVDDLQLPMMASELYYQLTFKPNAVGSDGMPGFISAFRKLVVWGLSPHSAGVRRKLIGFCERIFPGKLVDFDNENIKDEIVKPQLEKIIANASVVQLASAKDFLLESRRSIKLHDYNVYFKHLLWLVDRRLAGQSTSGRDKQRYWHGRLMQAHRMIRAKEDHIAERILKEAPLVKDNSIGIMAFIVEADLFRFRRNFYQAQAALDEAFSRIKTIRKQLQSAPNVIELQELDYQDAFAKTVQASLWLDEAYGLGERYSVSQPAQNADNLLNRAMGLLSNDGLRLKPHPSFGKNPFTANVFARILIAKNQPEAAMAELRRSLRKPSGDRWNQDLLADLEEQYPDQSHPPRLLTTKA